MIRLLVAAALLIASAGHAAAQGAYPRAGAANTETKRLWFEVNITPKPTLSHGAYLGGQVIIDVKLVSSDPFKRLRLQMPQIRGARLETLVRPHTVQINVFGGKGYSHQARYAMFPQVDGTLVLPKITVTGILQARDGRTFEFTETYPQRQITVHPPDPSFAPGNWVVSQYVMLEEKWSADINQLRRGDTVRRTLSMTVAGAKARDLPPLELASNAGYRVLRTEVAAETVKTSAGFDAQIVQSWDIFVETDGVFQIDPVRFAFWDPGDARAKVIEAPARRIEPLRRDAAALKAQLREEIDDDLLIKKIGVLALLGLPALAVVVVVILAASSALPSRADMHLWRAARRRASPLTFYADFQNWARRSLIDRPIVGESQLARLGKEATGEVRRMHEAVFGRHGDEVDPRRVSRRLISASIRMRLRSFRSAFWSRMSRLLFAQ